MEETLTKVAFPTDEHYPFQDERARTVALQIVRDFKPDIRIAGSDGLDFYEISRFDKDPVRVKAHGIQDEIDLWTKGQKEWQSAYSESVVFFLRSNHDDRLQKYLMRHPEMYDLRALQLPALLELNALGIGWEQDKGENANYELVVENRLLITHGEIVRKYSAYTAKAQMEKENYQLSVMTGHTHRGGSYFTQSRGELIQAHECFCLCNLNPGYVRNPNWQQGLALATVTHLTLTVELIPFFQKGNKTFAQWRDKEYSS
jgi:predicted phosphodiesterase